MKRITKVETTVTVELKKTRVAAYCRVSTASDEQLISLDAQKLHYEDYIQSNDDWEYAGLYYDEGTTGTKAEVRDGLQALLRDCEDGKIDLIITKSISRFSRNTTDCLAMVRKLVEMGVFIFFEKENINTGSMESELMLSILSSLAESESVSISENEKWGIRRRFQNGTFIVSYPPYGYANVNGEMVIVPEEAEVVRSIFADCLAGNGTYRIAKRLNEENIPTKKNGKWHGGTVNGILSNEKYIGDALFQKSYTDENFNRHINYGEVDQFYCENHHEAIISREDFDRTQAVLAQRAAEKGNGTNTSRYQNRYALSGRIRCGECGTTFKRRSHYKPSGDYIAWTCGKHIEDRHACSMLYVEETVIHDAFVTMINKLVFGHQKILKPLLESLKSTDDKDKLNKIRRIDQEIENTAMQKQTLVGLAAQGILEPAIYNEECSALAIEEERLLVEKKNLVSDIGGDRTKRQELEKLMQFTAKGQMIEQFDDDIFSDYVEKIVIESRECAAFHLKCGLQLKERLVR